MVTLMYFISCLASHVTYIATVSGVGETLCKQNVFGLVKRPLNVIII